MGARRRPGGAEHLVARHHHLHRTPRLLRQLHGERLEVDVVLAAEAAAELGRRHLHLRDVHRQQLGDLGPHHEVALRRGPDLGDAAVGVVRDRGLRLDVALVRRLGAELALDDDVGLGETGVDVAELGGQHGREVRRLGRRRRDALGDLVLVQQRRVGGHRLLDVDDVRQHLVLDLDQLQRALGDQLRGGGDGSDGVAVVQHLLARHHAARHVAEVDHEFARGGNQHGHVGEVIAGDHGLDAGQLLGGRGVDALDARVRMPGAQHLADELVGQIDVGGVAGLAGHLVDGVRPVVRIGADDLEDFLLVLQRGAERRRCLAHVVCSLGSRAAVRCCWAHASPRRRREQSGSAWRAPGAQLPVNSRSMAAMIW